MDLEFDNVTSGIFIAVLVTAVSVALYYMFQHASFAPQHHLPSSCTTSVLAKKRRAKKSDTKKHKQLRKQKQTLTEGDADDDDLEEEEEDLEEEEEEGEDNLDVPVSASFVTFSAVCDEGGNASIPKSEQLEGSNMAAQHQSDQKCDADSESDGHTAAHGITASSRDSKPYLVDKTSLGTGSSNSEDSDGGIIKVKQDFGEPSAEKVVQPTPGDSYISSRKKKRRAGKRQVATAATYSEDSKFAVVPLTQTEAKCTRETSPIDSQPTSKNDSANKYLREEIDKLNSQLKSMEQKLDESSKRVTSLLTENTQFRTKDEEIGLGLRVLQEQYTELLRTNKCIDHEKSMSINKVKCLHLENEQLLIRLRTLEENATQFKQKNKQLMEQLSDKESKLASAMASAPPPGSLPELVRAQEIAQALSNENCRLTKCLEQKDSELSQLHQAIAIHKKEIQALHESIKENNTVLKDVHVQLQVETTEYNSRITKLQRCCHEHEREKQDIGRQLAEALNELTLCRKQEKHHMETISSLQYQFNELNAQNHLLMDRASSETATKNSCIGELQAQLANTQNQLMRVTDEWKASEQRCSALSSKLDIQKQEDNAETTTSHNLSRLSTSEVGIGTDGVEVFQEEMQKPREDVAAVHLLDPTTEELNASRLALADVTAELAEARRAQQVTADELERYKCTLIQTEDTLARLQAVAESSEVNWHRLLTESQEAQSKLRDQLREAMIDANEAANNAEHLEQKLAHNEAIVQQLHNELKDNSQQPLSFDCESSGPSTDRKQPFNPDEAPICNPAQRSTASTPQEMELTSDVDSDAVLVDHTDLREPRAT